MIIELHETIHVIIRRNFETDLRRHFIGHVTYSSDSSVRAEGYVFVLNTLTNEYIRRPEKRTRIISLTDSGNIINILSADAILENVKYIHTSDKHMVVTDNKTFTLDINEFSAIQ